jgi:hypothetical protein
MGNLTTLANLKAWVKQMVPGELKTIPASPGPYTVTVDKATAWVGDAGVTRMDTGALLTLVTGTPGTGQYAAAAGVYTFNVAQAGKSVTIVYETVGLDDGVLTRLVTAASTFIQTWLSRQIASQSYDELRDGHGKQRLPLANYPVTAITMVTVDGVAIPPAPDTISPGYRLVNDHVILNGYWFTRGMGNVEITYTAGYSSTPADIEQACIELCALKYRARDRIGLVSQAMGVAGGTQTTAYTQKDMTDEIKTLLQRYRKVAPI